jgi:hypothetical protein
VDVQETKTKLLKIERKLHFPQQLDFIEQYLYEVFSYYMFSMDFQQPSVASLQCVFVVGVAKSFCPYIKYSIYTNVVVVCHG